MNNARTPVSYDLKLFYSKNSKRFVSRRAVQRVQFDMSEGKVDVIDVTLKI